MHDTMFAKEIIDALNGKLKKLNKDKKITAVTVSLSPLSHVTPETLQETYKLMVKSTPFSRVLLKITPLQLGIKCEACKKGFLVDKPTFVCPECHSSSLNLIYEKEFAVDSIETICKNSSKKGRKT